MNKAGKVKNVIKHLAFSGIMASVLMISNAAIADVTVLPSKTYVDDGLRAVYQKAAQVKEETDTNIDALVEVVGGYADVIGNKADLVDFNELKNKVNDEETGLATKASNSELEELKTTVNAMDGTAYTGTNGVVVNGHDVELNVAAEQGAMYVYTSEGWAPLPVQDTWTAAAH